MAFLTPTERRAAIEAAKRYPKGMGWSYFGDKKIGGTYPAVNRLCLEPASVSLG